MRNSSQSTRIRLVFASAVLAAGFAMGAAAQSSTAAVMGDVKPDDVVLVQNVETGFSREVKPSDSGRYYLRKLPTGTYSVTVKHPDGSSEPAKVVTLRVGSTARVQ